MKKLLNISVIATLAVLPFAANAEVGDAVAGDPGTTNASAPVAANAPKYNVATEGANDGNLATAGYVKGAYNAAIKAINKVSETADSAIKGVKVNSSALTPDANGTVNVTVAEGATNGTVAVNGADVAVHGLGSAAYVNTGDLADTAGTYSNSTSGLTATTIQDAIDELATNVGDHATQDGVENTVETATITATVPTLTTWGADNSTGTVGVTVSSIVATYAEPTP